MLKEVFTRLSPKSRPPPSEPLVFIKPGGGIPFDHWGRLNPIFDRLRKDPQTSPIMEAIERGPNAALYKNLIESIKAVRVPKGQGVCLAQAAAALFFGKTVTDAHIEGMIRFGGPVGWSEAIGIYPLDLSETRRPEYILIEQRVEEIRSGEFVLPKSKEDLLVEVDHEATRIDMLLLDGTLERKARTMKVNPRRARDVGKKMVTALDELRVRYIPELS